MNKVLLILRLAHESLGYPENIFDRMEKVADEGQDFQCKFDGATIAYGVANSSNPIFMSTYFDK